VRNRRDADASIRAHIGGMKLYHPELLYLVIPVGALVTAALIWLVALVWPEAARAERPALREEAPGEAARPAPKAPAEMSGVR
jgi:hypothetical protein